MEKEVQFRVLQKCEYPKLVTDQVIPEYRALERALCCVVDGKVYLMASRGEKRGSEYSLRIERLEVEALNGEKKLIVHAKFKDPKEDEDLWMKEITYPLVVLEIEMMDLPDLIELKTENE